ncbi:EI24 domain-containing protein [Longispora albida]|uniref:EI24 domain-containing protein n=1 Tax=Longispora albida TaxID=203523 RepID=UPI000360938F
MRDFFAGVGYLGKGIGMWFRSPGLLALGLIPALIAAVLLGGVLITFWVNLGDISEALTGYADGWSEGWRTTVQVVTGVALAGASLFLGMLLYTALTLAIGDPFYEKISEKVEAQLGGVRGEVEVPWYTSLGRSIVDSLRLIAMSILFGIPLFLCGFIPFVGQTVVPVVGALIGGWFLGVELAGVPFQRRGFRLKGRRAVLKQRRAMVVGFGATVFVLFLIPGGAVLVTPAAVAGATLMARDILGES